MRDQKQLKISKWTKYRQKESSSIKRSGIYYFLVLSYLLGK